MVTAATAGVTLTTMLSFDAFEWLIVMDLELDREKLAHIFDSSGLGMNKRPRQGVENTSIKMIN